MKSAKKTWNPTKYRCLVRHHSGTYYARCKRGNKLHWKSLGTKTLSVAFPRLKEHPAAESGRQESGNEELGESSPKTMGDLLRIRRERVDLDVALKDSTKHYWGQIHSSLRKSWEGFDDLKISEVTRTQCERWASRMASQVSTTRYSNAISALKHLLEIAVDGDPSSGTKNGEVRRVPIIQPLQDLLTVMQQRRDGDEHSEKVLKVNEAQKAMDHAAEKVGIARLTHHDLRHFYATVCIESGVDVPTVAKWLGHKDGGALAMRVYGHLCDEHSRAAAKKVRFE